MQINSFNNLNFQKKLVATAHIGDSYNPQSVEIYHMDKESDFDELKEKFSANEWEDAFYSKRIMHFFKKDCNQDRYYVIEAGDEIINYADTYHDEDSDAVVINFLETAPKYAKDSGHDRLFKYAGETMLSFLAKVAQESDISKIKLEYRDVKSTRDFYFSQCGFLPAGVNRAVLYKHRFNDLIEQNEYHTGNNINLLT